MSSLNNSQFKNNGQISNIRDTDYSKGFTDISYSNSPDTSSLRNCDTQNALQGILDETLLSNTFFSVDNIQNIQNMLRYYFYKEKNKIVSEQSNNELLTIMRAIYLKYSNSSANSINEIKSEVTELNKIVTEYSLKQMYINYDNYDRYLDGLETLPVPVDLPKAPEKSNFSYDLSKRNDMDDM